jgi:hypothetical protein
MMLTLTPHPAHRTTDPACRYHRPPRSRLARWRFERNRGRPCPRCFRAFDALLALAADAYARELDRMIAEHSPRD